MKKTNTSTQAVPDVTTKAKPAIKPDEKAIPKAAPRSVPKGPSPVKLPTQKKS